ncbi:hypothetical protein P9D51_05215 [Bacillus sonorensis]|uniref:hypothetical protein n=1 Tax=Bacillus TaxID=1386 RepID=UPI000496CD8E|nr:hypothetical protein [Bacillus sonorensis]MCY8027527.1 hypothetical protein [Bacillus sonorensis]MCY8087746.1 hypothetical protein [Bacillus sonorensis]MEC1353582.1 hypothetical protein [Bacillus sonorensis]MEC1425540.1 hypothetical protein [Bacillus sonorensis]MEC1441598.1 hypothetical protein [Bacillus sonorensis]
MESKLLFSFLEGAYSLPLTAPNRIEGKKTFCFTIHTGAASEPQGRLRGRAFVVLFSEIPWCLLSLGTIDANLMIRSLGGDDIQYLFAHIKE